MQTAWLFLLAVPVAAVSWTMTHEEVFREARNYFARRSRRDGNLLTRKFFYLFTCEYCFSHWVALAFILLTGYQLLLPGWRGYLIALFALVFVSNFYMGLYGRLRLDIKKERVEIKAVEQEVEEKERREAA